MAKFRSKWQIIISLLLTLALLGGCTVPREVTGTPSEGDESIVLDWYINFSWFTTVWNESLVADAITRETGVTINFITPTGNEWEKLEAMMSSDTLPDLMTLGYWEPQIDRMIADGQVLALNKLADAYAPDFWEAAHPQRVAWYTEDDGNLYAYPNSSYTPSDYKTYPNIGSNQAFLVRRDIYEALGSPDMSTPEGFAQAIRRAAAEFTALDGKELIPIGLYDFDKDGNHSLDRILPNLLAVPFEEDGLFVDRATHPDYIVWMKVFRALHEEGYLPSEVFLDRRVQLMENVSVGSYFCMFYQHTDIADQQLALYSQNPGCEYIAVDGPKNPAGDNHTLTGVGINGWTVSLIGGGCERADLAIKLMSFLMCEEGQKLAYLGVEGETYDMVDNSPLIRPKVQEVLNTDRVEYNRVYGADNTYWMFQDLVMQQAWQPDAQPPLAQPREWSYPYVQYTAQYETVYTNDTPAGNANQNIREEWGRTLPKLLTAPSDEAFDVIFNAYLERRGELGFYLTQQEAQRQMEEANRRLNIS